jgi:hypothetical protein
MDHKIVRIVKSKHVIEVYYYDRLPEGAGGGKRNAPILDEAGNPVQTGTYHYDYTQWDEETQDHKLVYVQDLKGFIPDEWLPEEDKRRAKEYRKTANYRSRERIRRLSLMNFKEGDLFLTLTFAENMTDLDFANKEVKKFMQRFKYKYGSEVPYLGVIEFQQRGAIHYHFLVGAEMGPDFYEDVTQWKESETLSKMWGNGFAYVEQIYDNDNLGAYLIKYLLKDIGDDRLSGRKHYLVSKGLEKPEIKKKVEETQVILDSLAGYYPTYTSEYYNVFCGNVKYMEYNLKRGQEDVRSLQPDKL